MIKERKTMRIVPAAVAALAAGLMFAAPAHADNHHYLFWLRNVAHLDEAISDSRALDAGHDACVVIRDKGEAAAVDHLTGEGITRPDAEKIVKGAHQDLCPS